MAKTLLVEVIDDIDETPIVTGGEHITFAVNGTSYEIDLGDANAREFHRKLDYYIAHSTRVASRSAAANPAGPAIPSRDPRQTKAIRDWARLNGYDVSHRGRIPSTIETAFAAAH